MLGSRPWGPSAREWNKTSSCVSWAFLGLWFSKFGAHEPHPGLYQTVMLSPARGGLELAGGRRNQRVCILRCISPRPPTPPPQAEMPMQQTNHAWSSFGAAAQGEVGLACAPWASPAHPPSRPPGAQWTPAPGARRHGRAWPTVGQFSPSGRRPLLHAKA